MTKRQFFTLLRKAHREMKYKVVVYGEEYHINKTLRIVGPKGTFCPVTFAYFYERRQVISQEDAHWTGLNLGLISEIVEDVIVAADSWSEFEQSATQKELAKALDVT